MLSIEYDMLVFIHKHSGCSWTEALNEFDPEKQCRVSDAVLKNLLDQDLVELTIPGQKPPECRLRLAPKALYMILLHEEDKRKAEEQRRWQQRENRWSLWFALIAAVVGAITGALLPVLISWADQLCSLLFQILQKV